MILLLAPGPSHLDVVVDCASDTPPDNWSRLIWMLWIVLVILLLTPGPSHLDVVVDCASDTPPDTWFRLIWMLSWIVLVIPLQTPVPVSFGCCGLC